MAKVGTDEARTNLIGLLREELAQVITPIDPRPYRAEQIFHWLNRRLALDFNEMTNLSKAFRHALAENCLLADPSIVDTVRASDGTIKYALAYGDGSIVEAVSMPMEGHVTLCLSSQTGCAVGCGFCVTGALGAGRNLSGGEIFAQYRLMARAENAVSTPLNVVFMGMGEPLLNLDGVERALILLQETVSPKRVTVSTSGIVPGLTRLAALPRRPNLAVSLNGTTQEQRLALMPAAARWPLQELMRTLRAFPLEKGRRITIEYVLIAGFNDGKEDARRLPKLLTGIPVKVNLIPLNPDPIFLPTLAPPSDDTIGEFAKIIAKAGLNVTVRRSKGSEITAACGQLRGRVEKPGAGH